MKEEILLKPKERHCLLIFYRDKSINSDGGYLEAVEEILIEDHSLVSEIISIGYTRKEMQSLFCDDFYSYVTVDEDIFLKKENKTLKARKSYKFVMEFLKTTSKEISKLSTSFNFSFPEEMINKKTGFLKSN